MLHGVIFAPHAGELARDPDKVLPEEIWSAFASGTQMQELYVSPKLLDKAGWDTLATAIKWARANGNTLVDTHWIGGDPLQSKIYGWASWSPAKGIIALRNPSDRPGLFSADPKVLFELPAKAPKRYRLTSPKGDKPPGDGVVESGREVVFALEPFEVVVFEAHPAE